MTPPTHLDGEDAVHLPDECPPDSFIIERSADQRVVSFPVLLVSPLPGFRASRFQVSPPPNGNFGRLQVRCLLRHLFIIKIIPQTSGQSLKVASLRQNYYDVTWRWSAQH